MKARQQAAEEAAKDGEGANKDADAGPNSQEPQPQAVPPPADSVVFDGGFFQVESPAKPSGQARHVSNTCLHTFTCWLSSTIDRAVHMPVGSQRRSSRLSAAVLPQASPSSSYLSPRRVTRRSLALAQTPAHAAASPAQPVRTPAYLSLSLNQTPGRTPKPQRGTPQLSHNKKDTADVSLCFSPVKEVLSDVSQPEGSPECQSEKGEINTIPHLHCPPSISVVEEGTPADTVDVDLPPSPCEALPPVSQAPEPPSLSFTLSPCATPSRAFISCPPAAHSMEAQESACHTPDSSVVEVKPFKLRQSRFCSEQSAALNASSDSVLFHNQFESSSCGFRRLPGWTLSATSSRH